MEASNDLVVHIKVEPQHNDASSASAANSNISNHAECSGSVNSRRATASDGKPFSSGCFEPPYLSRPLFHRLRCGHDVATSTIQRCGANCAPPTRSTDSDAKPSDTNFSCPDPDCVRKAAVTPRLDPKTKRRIYGRPCQLAHVRGRDPQADLDWEVEKKHLAELRGRAQRVNPKDKELLRKTSRSPIAQRPLAAPPSQRTCRGSSALTTEQLALEMDDATLKLFLAQKGKRTRALRSNMLETKEEIVLDTAERNTTAGDIDMEPSGSTGSSAGTSKVAPLPSFVENVDGRYEHCDNCDALLSGEYFECEDCMEVDQNYALCGECNKNAYALHLRANPSHRMVLRQSNSGVQGLGQDAGAVVDIGTVELRCVCKSPDIRFMLSCQDCSRFFHPGCIGKGSQDKALYESRDRETLFEADFGQMRENGTFLCHSCDALHKFNAGIAAQRRNGRKHADLLLDFKPKLMAHKKMAFRKAKTLGEKIAIEQHFAALEAQMDEASSLELEDWKLLLAQASKVPFPHVQACNRKAEGIVIASAEAMVRGTVPDLQGGTGPLPTNRVKTDTDDIEVPSQEYRYGGQITLPMGSGKQGR